MCGGWGAERIHEAGRFEFLRRNGETFLDSPSSNGNLQARIKFRPHVPRPRQITEARRSGNSEKTSHPNFYSAFLFFRVSAILLPCRMPLLPLRDPVRFHQGNPMRKPLLLLLALVASTFAAAAD